MNILLLTDYYPPDKLGGVGEIARNLKAAYERAGHNVVVVTTGQKRDEELSHGIIRSSSNLMLGVFLSNFAVYRLLNRQRIHAIHMHQSSTTLFLFLRLLRRSWPKIVNSFQVSYVTEMREIRKVRVDDFVHRPRLREYVEKFLYAPVHIVLDVIGYAFADTVTAVSKENRDELLRTYGRISRKSITVVPNGVDTTRFGAETEFKSNELSSQLADKVVFSYIGVFRTRKRVFNLLYALQQVIQKHPSAVLLVVGGGRGYEDELFCLVEELGLREHVISIGNVPNEEVPFYLSLTDVFCLPSSYEGMPIAILEAMSMSKAVLATDGYGMRDLIVDGQTGRLVQVDDVNGLSRAMVELAGNVSLRIQLGANAKKAVHAHYNWDEIAETYLGLIVEQ